MKKFVFLAAPISMAFAAAAPLSAQDEDAPEAVYSEEEGEGDMPMGPDMMAGLGAMFGELFKVEPLTEDQTTRMPVAEGIAMKIMPDGSMAEIINSMVDGFMGPLMAMGPSPAQGAVTKGLGISRFELDGLDEEQIAEIAAIVDPAWQERSEREKNALPAILSEVATIMEPSMRKAMAELFAINFEATELTELDAFFSTTVGSKFARESYKMAADPRILSASFEAMPQIMSKVGDLKKVMDDATADLPAIRSFDELSASEKARISELSGLSEEEIAYGGSYATEGAEEAAYDYGDEDAAEAIED